MSKFITMCPARISMIAGLLPLYGTCTMLMPVARLNISPARWLVLPTPGEAKVSSPGCALASAISSLTFLAGVEGWTTSTLGA